MPVDATLPIAPPPAVGDRPDGITPAQIDPPPSRFGHGASLLSLVVLGTVMALGLSGLLGGRDALLKAAGNGVELTVQTPQVIRNGQFFETTLQVTAQRDVAKLVLRVPAALWRDFTVNSAVPAAAEEAFQDGDYAFTFDKLKAGDRFETKFDLQINPDATGLRSADIGVFDGERPLAAVPVQIRVLP
ncbi:hypothetical protein [Xylophilus sp. Leaf220]|uniref:hypothetical protein n=1 Tax=Xylophilus sp. Leaf220 TaxID=1735686 RepID=UPI0006F78CFB|nr:hypothetical protein [Xylophilus sp. Leaf220]KQM80123.1 hypothetical protein ASE76_02890 [Xylophilus sp. Leaf220]